MTRTIQDTVFAETISSGTVGATPAAVVTAMIETRLAAFLSAGTPAWAQVASGLSGTLGREPAGTSIWTTGADFDVYHTVGDRNLVSGVGDTSGYVAFDARNATQMRAVQGHDWSTPDQDLATGAFARSWNFVTSTQMNIYGSINEYEMLFIVNQTSTWHFIWFGIPIRTQTQPGHRGVARITSAVTGGIGDQQIPIDRDNTSDLLVDENIWIVNQTADGDALAGTTINVIPVVSTGPGFIECDPTNDFVINSLIGLDPCPVGRALGSNMQSAFCTSETGTYADLLYNLVASAVNEAGVDPSTMGYHRGYRGEFSSTGSPASHRGVPSLLTWWSVNATPQDFPANGDVNRHNKNDTKLFAPFPALTGAAGYDPNLGPFTTVAP
jgi:hypothetical protein